MTHLDAWRPCYGLAAAALALAGCAIRPAGEDEERRRAAEAGRAWTEPVEVPPLPAKPGPEDYLRVAFLSNADLQARYWEWRSAIEQIPQDASFPNVAVPFSVMFSRENMKTWDRTTLGITNDPMTNIPFPTKVAAAGRRALERARAAGLRFEAAKFALQRQVLDHYYDLALLAETLRLQEERIDLLRATLAQAETRVRTGAGSPQEAAQAGIEYALARNALENLRLEAHHHGTARLNAAVGRGPDDPLPLPEALPEPRPLPVTDADLVRLGAGRSPELAALARDVEARKENLGLAAQAYLPDFSLTFNLTGDIARTVGGMLILPTRLEAIRAAIRQAEADLKGAEAARTQYGRDLAASFVINLAVLRNAERQVALFRDAVLPRTEEIVRLTETSYAAGRASYDDLLAARRAQLDVRLATARLRIDREKSLTAIESWSAVDVETLGPALAMPAGRAGMSGGRRAGPRPAREGSGAMGTMR